MKPKLLFIGDAACQSGFARASHAYLDAVKDEYDVTVLGINYRGDPHDYPYPIYAAGVGGDPFGVGRLTIMCDIVTQTEQDGQKRVTVPKERYRKPDVIVIQQDPWNFKFYFDELKRVDKDPVRGYHGEFADVPVVGIVAVDALNCRGDALNDLSLAIFWTQFGFDEARKGGYKGPGVVIPLGVDLDVYHPMDKVEARRRRGFSEHMDNAFIVGCVNRNQPRKRWDLIIRYFARWVHTGPLKDAYLFLHCAPTGDAGVDPIQLAIYYGVIGRVSLIEPPPFYGVSEEMMRDTYNVFDLQITTSMGEGFGLTTIEGMACGIPQLCGDWAGLGDWARDAARLVPCTSTSINTVVPMLNTIGGVPDEKVFVREMDTIYRSKEARRQLREAGLNLTAQERFRWPFIGEQFRLVVGSTIRSAAEERVKRVTEEVVSA